jgi:hypothetical protein
MTWWGLLLLGWLLLSLPVALLTGRVLRFSSSVPVFCHGGRRVTLPRRLLSTPVATGLRRYGTAGWARG